jgi:hypothetical protein
MLKVGKRVAGHLVLFQEGMHLGACLKAQKLPDILGSQRVLPLALHRYAFHDVAGLVAPLFLKAFHECIP